MVRDWASGLMLCAALVGCGGGGDSADGSSSSGSTNTAATAGSNAGVRARLDACGTAINAQGVEAAALSHCLVGKYVGTLLSSGASCSAELTADGSLNFTVDGSVRSFKQPYAAESFTKKSRPVGQSGSGYSTTGYSVDWGVSLGAQSFVLDFNNDLRDGLQLMFTDGSETQTCYATVP